MKRLIVSWAIAGGLLLGTAGLAAAQDTTTTQQTTTTTTSQTDNGNDKSADVRTVTGCLRSGESSGEYELVGQNGSTWELRSDSVDLASHVGHKVTITGAVKNAGMHGMKEGAKKEAEQHGMNTSSEHGHMTVTNMSMVSESCK
jgi:hypothetical protein